MDSGSDTIVFVSIKGTRYPIKAKIVKNRLFIKLYDALVKTGELEGSSFKSISSVLSDIYFRFEDPKDSTLYAEPEMLAKRLIERKSLLKSEALVKELMEIHHDFYGIQKEVEMKVAVITEKEFNMELVKLIDGEAKTTTLAIAEGTGNDHASVMKLIRNYTSDFEEFGRVRFEIQPFDTAGGTQKREIAFLNQEQATLIMTYMRNSEIVRSFKKQLVKAFYEIASMTKIVTPTNLKDALKLAYEQQCLIEEQSEKIVQMIPKAEFYDTVAKTSQWEDMITVAKTLNFVGVGRNKLMEFLRVTKVLTKYNQPYQNFVDKGYFKLVECPYNRAGEVAISTKTVVSQKGMEFIARLLRMHGYYTADEVKLNPDLRLAA